RAERALAGDTGRAGEPVQTGMPAAGVDCPGEVDAVAVDRGRGPGAVVLGVKAIEGEALAGALACGIGGRGSTAQVVAVGHALQYGAVSRLMLDPAQLALVVLPAIPEEILLPGAIRRGDQGARGLGTGVRGALRHEALGTETHRKLGGRAGKKSRGPI